MEFCSEKDYEKKTTTWFTCFHSRFLMVKLSLLYLNAYSFVFTHPLLLSSSQKGFWSTITPPIVNLTWYGEKYFGKKNEQMCTGLRSDSTVVSSKMITGTAFKSGHSHFIDINHILGKQTFLPFFKVFQFILKVSTIFYRLRSE